MGGTKSVPLAAPLESAESIPLAILFWEFLRACLRDGQCQDLSEAKQIRSDSSKVSFPEQPDSPEKEAGKSELLCSSQLPSSDPFVKQGIQLQNLHMGEGELTLSASAPPWNSEWAEPGGLPLPAPPWPPPFWADARSMPACGYCSVLNLLKSWLSQCSLTRGAVFFTKC